MQRVSVSSATLDLKSILGGGIMNALQVPTANNTNNGGNSNSPSNKSPTNQ